MFKQWMRVTAVALLIILAPYAYLILKLGESGYLTLLFCFVVVNGRLGLYAWRKSKGRKDPLDKARWYDVF